MSSPFKANWLKLKKSIWYFVSEVGVECLTRDWVYKEAEKIHGFDMDRPHLKSICDSMFNDVVNKCLN